MQPTRFKTLGRMAFLATAGAAALAASGCAPVTIADERGFFPDAGSDVPPPCNGPIHDAGLQSGINTATGGGLAGFAVGLATEVAISEGKKAAGNCIPRDQHPDFQ